MEDNEGLYRRLEPAKRPVRLDDDGSVRVSREAFLDPYHEPSVDRAVLRDAEAARELPENGLAILYAQDVRASDPVPNFGKSQKVVVSEHALDVVPKPLPENPAHSLLVMRPAIKTDGAFRRMRDRLAHAAKVLVVPPSFKVDPPAE